MLPNGSFQSSDDTGTGRYFISLARPKGVAHRFGNVVLTRASLNEWEGDGLYPKGYTLINGTARACVCLVTRGTSKEQVSFLTIGSRGSSSSRYGILRKSMDLSRGGGGFCTFTEATFRMLWSVVCKQSGLLDSRKALPYLVSASPLRLVLRAKSKLLYGSAVPSSHSLQKGLPIVVTVLQIAN